MYPDRFRLPFLARALVAAAERKRPGLGLWNPSKAEALTEVFRTELKDLKERFLELFSDRAYWDRVEQQLMTVCLPRYLTLAEKQTRLESRDYGLWRGGDLIARVVYALVGFAVGLFLVKAPFIPIPTTWDFLAFLMLLGAPFFPDVQVSFLKSRYGRSLATVVADMEEAEAQLRAYEPLAPPEPLAELPATPEPTPNSSRTDPLRKGN